MAPAIRAGSPRTLLLLFFAGPSGRPAWLGSARLGLAQPGRGGGRGNHFAIIHSSRRSKGASSPAGQVEQRNDACRAARPLVAARPAHAPEASGRAARDLLRRGAAAKGKAGLSIKRPEGSKARRLDSARSGPRPPARIGAIRARHHRPANHERPAGALDWSPGGGARHTSAANPLAKASQPAGRPASRKRPIGSRAPREIEINNSAPASCKAATMAPRRPLLRRASGRTRQHPGRAGRPGRRLADLISSPQPAAGGWRQAQLINGTRGR